MGLLILKNLIVNKLVNSTRIKIIVERLNEC